MAAAFIWSSRALFAPQSSVGQTPQQHIHQEIQRPQLFPRHGQSALQQCTSRDLLTAAMCVPLPEVCLIGRHKAMFCKKYQHRQRFRMPSKCGTLARKFVSSVRACVLACLPACLPACMLACVPAGCGRAPIVSQHARVSTACVDRHVFTCRWC